MDGREHRWFILTASVAPLIGVLVAMVLLWNRLFSWSDLVALVVMYTICAFGISTGYHRMLTHRSFKTTRPIYLALATAGAMAGQGPPIIWAAHHRRHHRVADREGDPHSPHLGFEPGVKGILKGLWHAHLGWLFDVDLRSEPMRYCPDLVRDKALRWLSEKFVLVVAAGIVLPGLIGLALTGTLTGALTGALWGGLVRLFLVNHMTYAVNSVGHYFGRRRFGTQDHSRNVAWLAIPSFGEAWHNNHHAFPRSARHGMKWWEVDLSAIFIWSLEKVGLASHVIRIDPEKLAMREGGISLVGHVRADRTPAQSAEELLTAPPPPPLSERRPKSELVSVTDVE